MIVVIGFSNPSVVVSVQVSDQQCNADESFCTYAEGLLEEIFFVVDFVQFRHRH